MSNSDSAITRFPSRNRIAVPSVNLMIAESLPCRDSKSSYDGFSNGRRGKSTPNDDVVSGCATMYGGRVVVAPTACRDATEMNINDNKRSRTAVTHCLNVIIQEYPDRSIPTGEI